MLIFKSIYIALNEDKLLAHQYILHSVQFDILYSVNIDNINDCLNSKRKNSFNKIIVPIYIYILEAIYKRISAENKMLFFFSYGVRRERRTTVISDFRRAVRRASGKFAVASRRDGKFANGGRHTFTPTGDYVSAVRKTSVGHAVARCNANT